MCRSENVCLDFEALLDLLVRQTLVSKCVEKIWLVIYDQCLRFGRIVLVGSHGDMFLTMFLGGLYGDILFRLETCLS